MENQPPDIADMINRYHQGGWGELTNQEIFFLSEYLLLESKKH